VILLDLNSPEFAKFIIDIIDQRIDKKVPEIIKKSSGFIYEKVGKVVTSGNGATIQIYIENSTTAVEIKNPRSLSLTAGQLVAIVFPNFKNDNSKYIDRLL
jgi:hypothetical protein